MKYIAYTLMAVINIILQSTVFESFAIIDIKPNTALIIVVSVAFIQGEGDGIFTGLVTGFLQDCLFSAYLGCNMFIYATIGMICGYCFKAFFKESFLLPLAIVAGADIFYSFAYYVLNLLLMGYSNFFAFVLPKVLPELVYTVLISAFLYRIVYTVTEFLNSRKNAGRRLF